jgi:uroporphyrinogen-III decarboxylase
MNLQEWEVIRKCANMEDTGDIPVGLIVDSPWIPGYLGISTLDYYTMPDIWLESNLKIKRDFPGLILLPDFWVEYGMATEPSGFGCKIVFFEDRMPNINHIISSAEDIDQISNLPVPNPKTDGLMPLVLNLYKNAERKLKDKGESIKIITARGPLTTATHLMGLTEFLIALKIDPEATHKLLKLTATLAINWLEAQSEALSEVGGIMVLDDVVGFLSKEDYMEFAHPYLKSIFSSFPECIKIYHNDTDNAVCYEFLEDIGVNIFNFTHKQAISKVKALVGDSVCLLGNVPPLDVLVQGTAEAVRSKTLDVLKDYGGTKGIIVSAGGGASPGAPGENIRAMIDAVAEFNMARSR